ncbi:MAG TPA: metalloregulator ArsR/SmtB family transcription factor [Gammaproteobacteria bacterium]|nr:metalloregulator ArsR/SmtB family transcription factor [Gammaproteobacteria bacterium]
MEINDATEILTALSQSTRLEIFRSLVRQGPEGLAAGEIGEALSLAPATLSFHLNSLRHAGLVDPRREGRRIFYVARYETISELMGFLMENCCQGRPEACAFLQEDSLVHCE